jgi:tripartite-type tricarboxylate transporter receptor subunit TctC
VLPPNTPPDKVKIIREAFAKTIEDEAAIADRKQKNLEFDPSTAEELETLAKDVISQPPEIVVRVKKLLTK